MDTSFWREWLNFRWLSQVLFTFHHLHRLEKLTQNVTETGKRRKVHVMIETNVETASSRLGRPHSQPSRSKKKHSASCAKCATITSNTRSHTTWGWLTLAVAALLAAKVTTVAEIIAVVGPEIVETVEWEAQAGTWCAKNAAKIASKGFPRVSPPNSLSRKLRPALTKTARLHRFEVHLSHLLELQADILINSNRPSCSSSYSKQRWRRGRSLWR